jgi:hypothetical protein
MGGVVFERMIVLRRFDRFGAPLTDAPQPAQ